MKPTQFLYHKSLFCTLFFLLAAVTVMGQTATITITNSSIGGSGILNNANYDSGAERVWTQNGVDFGGKAITCNQNNTPAGAAACQYIQAQASNGVIYNTTALPGRIVSVQYTGAEAVASTLYAGSTGRLVNNTAANYAVNQNNPTEIGTSGNNTTYTWTMAPVTNYTYFAIKRSSSVQYFSSIVITYETASPGPILIASPSSITGLGYMEGGSSTEQTFSVNGSNLNPASGNISITAPANFQVSTDNTTYNNSLNLPYSGGILAATNVYVRLNSGLSAGTYTGNITIVGGGAANATVSVEGVVTPIITGSCFSEDFSSITAGDNITTGGSSTVWTGNSNFPTVVKTYQAGGAVRMGNTTNPRGGSIESRALTEVSGDITVNILVKGWTTIEGGIKVSIDGQEQSLTYTAKMADPFELVTATFIGVTAGSNLKIETEGTSPNANQRCFIDSVEIICGGFPKYFISKQDGNWNTSSTWQSSEDGINWNDATTYPGASAESVVILADHTVEINNPAVVITNTTVYGTIEVTTAGAYSVDGDEQIELSIENGGVFLVNSPGSFVIPAGNAFGLVKTGGKLVAGPNMGSGTAFVNAYVGYLNGIFYFGDGGICEWDNSTTVFGSSSPDDKDIFFPYDEGDMPILRIVTTPAYSFGTNANDNILNCVLEIVSPATFTVRYGDSSPQRTKTIVGGVRGSGKLIMENSNGPLIIGGDGTDHLNDIVPELGGTASIVTNSTNGRLEFPNGANVPSGASFTIENNANVSQSFKRSGGTFNIDGTLDITNQSITNSASGGISVNNGGTIRTRHTGGLFGTGSAIPSNTGNLALNNGSTVEYYATENQDISTGKDYYHIIFSGGGIKTPQNVTNVHSDGSITISGNTVVDYSLHNLGSTAYNTTSFNMDGGKLILGTGGNQPRPGGTYNITGGAIEFTGSSVTNIKVGPDYYDVIISGQNITPNGKTLNIQNILSVTSTGEFTIPSVTDSETPYVVNAHKGVQVATGGELVFENNAQLMQDATGVNNTGNIKVNRLVVDMDNNITEQMDYVYWSSPVSSQNIRNFSPGSQYIQWYNEANDYFYNVNTTSEPNFVTGKGYAFSAEVDAGHPAQGPGNTIGYDETYSFIGTPHNGDGITYPINRSADTGGVEHGYNLVGNPYPSNINVEKLFVDNPGIYTAVFLWTNNNYTQYQMGSNYTGNNYAFYNNTGGAPATYTPSDPYDGPLIPNGIIKTGQGFIVQKKDLGSGSIIFNNDIRETSVGDFYQKGFDMDKDRYWLTLTTNQGIVTTLLVGYVPGATDEFEKDYDAELMGGSDAVYTINNDHKLTIQGRAPFRINDVLPLGYKAFGTGTHIISVYQKEGIFAESQDIWLVDMLLNKTVNLSKKPYKFITRAGEYGNRFKIVYRPSFQTGVDIHANDISMLKVGQQIEISSTIDRISEVEVFDLNSIPVFKKNEINQNKFIVNAVSFNHQILIIKVKTETGETVTRKFVMK